MKISHLLIAAVIVIYGGWKLFYHPPFPSEANEMLTSYSGNRFNDNSPCLERSHCVYAYLAPWCPACKMTLPILTRLRETWQTSDDPGLKIIIGNGSKDQLEGMAKQVGAPVFLDKDDHFLKAIGVRHFPYFVVVDDKDRIIARGNSARRWLEKEVNKR